MTLTQIKPAGLSKPVDLADNEKIRLGTGNDLEIYHNGSNTYIDNHTGDLNIRGNGDDIFLKPVDTEVAVKAIPNGAVELYFDGAGPKLKTTSYGIETDSVRMGGFSLPRTQVGGYDYLTFGHGGTFGELDCLSGVMRIKAGEIQLANRFGNVEMLTCNSFGSVEAFHNGSKKFETTSGGVLTTGNTSTTGAFISTQTGGGVLSDNLSLVDGKKVKLGASDDLQIYHDGSNS